jgi:hypothetical protein
MCLKKQYAKLIKKKYSPFKFLPFSYQQGVYPVPPNTPVTPPVGQAAPQQQNGQENVNQAQENVEEMEDLDEEFRQRDWLDYLYTFSRFMVLLGIVYFYSNITRFLMVAAFFLVVYA